MNYSQSPINRLELFKTNTSTFGGTVHVLIFELGITTEENLTGFIKLTILKLRFNFLVMLVKFSHFIANHDKEETKFLLIFSCALS